MCGCVIHRARRGAVCSRGGGGLWLRRVVCQWGRQAYSTRSFQVVSQLSTNREATPISKKQMFALWAEGTPGLVTPGVGHAPPPTPHGACNQPTGARGKCSPEAKAARKPSEYEIFFAKLVKFCFSTVKCGKSNFFAIKFCKCRIRISGGARKYFAINFGMTVLLRRSIFLVGSGWLLLFLGGL